jgi:RHS repeat-associated protein
VGYLAANGLNESYAYDAFGNMLEAGNFNFVQAYTTANQLSGWSYDASGNLLIDGQNTGYAYDAEGRVSGVGTYSGSNGSYTFNPAYSYVYDAEGNRVAKTGGAATDYISFGGRQLARLSVGQWTDLIYGANGLLAEVPGTQNGAPVYRMVDHLGTAVGTLSSTGALLSLTDYAPFGEVFAGGSTDPYKFTGKERDTESGNDYFGARYYASSMGRWMSPDEVFADQHPSDPQSWNLYVYWRNNPLRNIDPNGRGVLSDVAWGIAKGVGTFAYNNTPIPGAIRAVKDLTNLRAAAVRDEAQGRATLGAIKALGSSEGRGALANAAKNAWNGMSTTDKASTITQATLAVGTAVAGGFAGGAGSADGVANALPSTVARAIPASIDTTTLGLPGASDVFVTSGGALNGMTSTEISNGLTINPSASGFNVFEFPTPNGIASPINRPDPGFVGGGKTDGGLPEFVIPNGPIPVKRD